MSVLALPRATERNPLQWRDLLLGRLATQGELVALYEAYYDGRHPLQFATSKYREAFGSLFGAFADNWCQIVVDAAVERLQVIGFNVGGEPSEDAWAIWQANALDVESVIAHTEACKTGHAFLLVDPNDGDPRITVEHPGQVVLATDPGNRRERLAALKRWSGDDDYEYATLYLPDVVLRFQSDGPISPGGLYQIDWVPRDDVASVVDNTLGVVPVIELANKPSLVAAPHSDLEPALSLQDAVNKLCSDMVIASEYGAFPQRVLTGMEIPLDPETGQTASKVQVAAAMSRLWNFYNPDAEAKITSLPTADLSNYVTAIDLFIQHLAAQTRTPPHYLLGQVVNASGDALSVAEAGLVSKCRTKILFFSDPWEDAMALALSATGVAVDHTDCEALWSDPERQTQAQLTDAAAKKKTLGVPLEVIWSELGYTPEQIAQMSTVTETVDTPVAAEGMPAAGPTSSPPALPPPETQPPVAPGGTDG